MKATAHGTLVLVRHGQSEWNLANRFTGWIDVDLTERGITEAREAGRMLASEGLKIDECFSSTLRRSIRTACLSLSGLDQCWVPLTKDARLNEQHCGSLTGHNKRELAKQFGADQVQSWRRKYDQAPPPIAADSPLQQMLVRDERYAVHAAEVPSSECLADTCARVQSVFEERIRPLLLEGKTVLVVSHGNTLRALVKLLDGVEEDGTFHLDLPTASPVVYSLDAHARPLAPVGFWGKSDVPRFGRFLMDEAAVLAAQSVMREQVTRDVAISTVSSSRGEGAAAIATCPAWSAPTAATTKFQVDGTGYVVRSMGVEMNNNAESESAGERAPDQEGDAEEGELGGSSYFEAERERITRDARHELRSLAERRPGGRGVGAGTEVVATVVLLRHGYSDFNARNVFTGWADPDLSNRGREEARLAGSILREAGVTRIERVYCSLLKRAIKTAWLMLDALEMQWVPVSYDWRLNERHYGALQGREKRACGDEYGFCQVARWRRGATDVPPPATPETFDSIDRRYEGVPVPSSESLEQCSERMVPFLRGVLMRDVREAVEKREAKRVAMHGGEHDGYRVRKPAGPPPIFVVASSENLLRSMIRELEGGLTEDQLASIDVPYATPLIFQLDKDLKPIASEWSDAPLRHGWYMGDPKRVTEVQQQIREQIMCRTGDNVDAERCAEAEQEPCIVPLV